MLQTRPCDGGGESSRLCEDGVYSAWSECVGVPCLEDVVETRACSEGGTQSRRCAEGTFSDWSACPDPPACDEGETEQQPCGFNGRGLALRRCVDGAFGPSSACADPDQCADGTTEDAPCAADPTLLSTRTCEEGRWLEAGLCVCAFGARETRPCGLNGRGLEVRECVEGVFEDWGVCEDTDVCVDGAAEDLPCGVNGRGVQSRGCVAGQWAEAEACRDDDLCADGTQEMRACGVNGGGVSLRRCVAGAYLDWSPCADPDVCENGAVRTSECENGGLRDDLCIEGQWQAGPNCVVPAGCDAPAFTFVLEDGFQSAARDFDTRAGSVALDAVCGDGAAGHELVVYLEVVAAQRVRFDATSDEVDPVLHLRQDCEDPDTELACDDDSGGQRNARLERDLDPGIYTLVLDTYLGGQRPDLGRITLSMERVDTPCEGDTTETGACPADPLGATIRARRCVNGVFSAWSSCFARCNVANADCRACTDAREVNDVQALASSLVAGVNVPNLNLCEGLDESDWFSMTAPSAGLLTVTATRAINGAFNFLVEAAAFEEVNMATTLRSTPDSTALIGYVDTASSIGFNVTPYFPEVGTRSGYTLTGTFQGSFACEHNGNAPGCLTCIDPGPADNARGQARELQFGQAVNGIVCSGLDPSDWYTFSLQAQTAIRIETSRNAALVSQGLMSESTIVVDEGGRFVINGASLENGVFVSRGSLAPGRYYIPKDIVAGVSQYRFTVRVEN